MPRVVSFIVLLAVVLLIGSMFFKVMVQFIVPLFLAAVFVVICKPIHEWMLGKCGARKRLAAALTTLAIVLIILLPLTGMLIKAVSEGVGIVQSITADGGADEDSMEIFIEKSVTALNKFLEKVHLPPQSSEEVFAYIQTGVKNFAAPLLFGGVEILFSTMIGLAIMVLSLFYFFSDGPDMLTALMQLSPLDDDYEKQLLDKFSDISRAVVLATLMSAFVQGLLAGMGYFFAGVDNLFFLTVLTMFMSMVPFVGGAAVWVPVCCWLYFMNGETTSAIVLALFCLTVVNMADNLVKPYVLHGHSNLHPLLALLSVIGGVQVLGPIGILVGPMLVAFLQALLNMLNKELQLLGKQENGSDPNAGLATAGAPAAAVEPTTQSASKPKES